MFKGLKNIIVDNNMYLICCCDIHDEKIRSIGQYIREKKKPCPKICLTEYKKSDVKASRIWNGLVIEDIFFADTVMMF